MKQNMHKTFKVLLVESEANLRRVITASLEQLGLDVVEASDAKDAHRIIEDESPDLLIVELDFPHGHNGKLINAFRKSGVQEQQAVIVTTTDRPSKTWRQHYRPGATIYKPFDMRHLNRMVLELVHIPDHQRNSESALFSRSNQ
jgi:two-component system phosphate regulon response regulator PhoB